MQSARHQSDAACQRAHFHPEIWSYKLTALLPGRAKATKQVDTRLPVSKTGRARGGCCCCKNTPLLVRCEPNRARQARTDKHLKCHQGAIQAGVTLTGPVCFIMWGNNKQNAYLPLPHISTRKHARRQRQTYLGTYRPTSTSACLQLPGNYTLTAANVTLVHSDAAAVSITVNQRVLSPASLVWTHAATSDHFPHAAPIWRNGFPLPATARTSPRPVKGSSRTLTPHRTYSWGAFFRADSAQHRDEISAWGLWCCCYVFFSVM